jgi:CRISPR-associated endonuclease/helicase Cas3
LKDRVERHDEIVEAMKRDRPAALGVTTQVCEMSLDLDADLLVTEECPVTSLIQRMGRCNREQDPRALGESGRVLVYAPESPAPYSDDDLKGLDEFLRETAGKVLSQTALEATLNGLRELPPWLGDNVIMFLTSGPYAVGPKADEDDATTFREGNEFNRPCVLSTDVGAYLGAEDEVQPGFIVPVPKKLAHCRDDKDDPRHRDLPRYLVVATDGHYHSAVGFCHRPLSEWGPQ